MDALELLRRVPKRVQAAVAAADGRLRWRKGAYWRQIPHDHPRRAAIIDRINRIRFHSRDDTPIEWIFYIARIDDGENREGITIFIQIYAAYYTFKYVLYYATPGPLCNGMYNAITWHENGANLYDSNYKFVRNLLPVTSGPEK